MKVKGVLPLILDFNLTHKSSAPTDLNPTVKGFVE